MFVSLNTGVIVILAGRSELESPQIRLLGSRWLVGDPFLGNKLIRILAILGAGLAGFVVTCLSKLLSQQIHWPGAPAPTSGCFSVSDCPQSWWTLPLFLFLLFGPALLYMALALAGFFRRWTRRDWTYSFICAGFLTLVFYIAYDAIGIYSGWAS